MLAIGADFRWLSAARARHIVGWRRLIVLESCRHKGCVIAGR